MARGRPVKYRVQSALQSLVLLVAIGAAVVYGPSYFRKLGMSDVARAKDDMSTIATGIDRFRIDTGRYPTSEEGLAALQADPGASGWKGPYPGYAIGRDPWNHRYIYRSPGDNGAYDLLSYGSDSEPGGSGDAADIYYFAH